MFRFLTSLFRRKRPRFVWVWELEETLVRAGLFRATQEKPDVPLYLGFAELHRLPEEEERLKFWIRATSAMVEELRPQLPRRVQPERVFLFGAGLLRFLGDTFTVRRHEGGRKLGDEEIDECLLSLLPRVREVMKGRAAGELGLERHEVSVVDGVLEEVLLDGRAVEESKGIGRELTFRVFLLLAPKELVQDFGVLLRSLSAREFSLLPLALPLASVLEKQVERPSGAIIFLDEEWTELAFLQQGHLARNTLVSIGVRQVREAIAEVLGFSQETSRELFSLWQGRGLSSKASDRLEELLKPTFTLFKHILSSSLDANFEGRASAHLWLFGPGERIPAIRSYLPGQPLAVTQELTRFFPVLTQEGGEQSQILPLQAAAWFILAFRQPSPWQERFIRALRLMQR